VERIEVYATVTPINFEMDIPSEVSTGAEENLVLDQLYKEAVNYGSNGRRGGGQTSTQTVAKGTKTTLATKRFPVSASNLVGFKAKVNNLPDAYEQASNRANLAAGNAADSVVVNAERLVSTFKQYAARKLQEALDAGVSGYENCVAVIKDINTKAVRGIVKVEFFIKRVSAKQFDGAGQSKRDGLWYRTDKVRKFFTTSQPSIGLIESIISDSLLAEDVVQYNNDFVFRRVLTTKGNIDGRVSRPYSIQMVRGGFSANQADDLQVASLLARMRRPKQQE